LARSPRRRRPRDAPTAIVTGASSGIGRGAAVALARDGFDVGVTWHTDEPEAQETARRVRDAGRRAQVRQLDLSDRDRIGDVIDDLAGSLGRLDVLVNNAAVSPRGGLLEETLERWDHTLAVNLTGPLLCAHSAVHRMIAQGDGGRIVNVTSIHEHTPLERAAAYAVSKAGLGMLTRVMALELAEHAITANAVAPGHVATPMNGYLAEHDRLPPRPSIPLGRIAHPEEIADAIAYLCSPSASYITGATLPVDGGLSLTAATRLREELEAEERARPTSTA
jgi:NAD(P)-dependent dehydrogenase (short-subunit alcohol dehydrogenase family)